jgi:hypothetical protein
MPHRLLAAASTTTDLLDTAGSKSYTTTSSTAPNIIQIVLSAIGIALSLLGVIFLCLILYGGWTYMTAGGDSTKVENAKHIITRAAIGLLIVLTSYSIIAFVIPLILCSTGVTESCSFFVV